MNSKGLMPFGCKEPGCNYQSIGRLPVDHSSIRRGTPVISDLLTIHRSSVSRKSPPPIYF